MSMSHLDKFERRIEAMLFASGEPLQSDRIAEILEIEPATVLNIVRKIRDRYREWQSPIEIVYLEGAFQMTTLPEYSNDIQLALEVRSTPLSSAAMEVLAVVAYNQPVTRAFIEEVRGVDCSGIIRSLVEKRLIDEAGRMNIPGRPIIYQTTPTFLRSFGLESLEKLPVIPEEKQSDDKEEPSELEGQIDFYQED